MVCEVEYCVYSEWQQVCRANDLMHGLHMLNMNIVHMYTIIYAAPHITLVSHKHVIAKHLGVKLGMSVLSWWGVDNQ